MREKKDFSAWETTIWHALGRLCYENDIMYFSSPESYKTVIDPNPLNL